MKRFDLWVEWDMNDQFVKTIVAEDLDEADYAAQCYIGENGIDREYEYRGYMVVEHGDAVGY